jgi:hypothetical protein
MLDRDVNAWSHQHITLHHITLSHPADVVRCLHACTLHLTPQTGLWRSHAYDYPSKRADDAANATQYTLLTLDLVAGKRLARTVLPSLDDPASKTIYTLSVEAPPDRTVLSNMEVIDSHFTPEARYNEMNLAGLAPRCAEPKHQLMHHQDWRGIMLGFPYNDMQ